MATTKKTTTKKTTKKKVAKKKAAKKKAAKKGAFTKPGSVRVHEVATSLGTDSATVVELAQGLGIEADNHMVFVTDAQAQQIRTAFAQRGQPPKKSSRKASGSSKKKGSKKKARKPKQAGATTITIQQGAGNPRLKNQCMTIIAGCGC